MIEFDNNGNPQPPGFVELGNIEFRQIFVVQFPDSETRNAIHEGYESYCHDLRKFLAKGFTQWLNGSFTTKKTNPNDIDLVNVFDWDESINDKAADFAGFGTNYGSKDTYMVDGYFVPVYPQNDPRFAITERWLNYWAEWFGHDRKKRPKALISVEIG